MLTERGKQRKREQRTADQTIDGQEVAADHPDDPGPPEPGWPPHDPGDGDSVTAEALFDGDPIPLTQRVSIPEFPVDSLPGWVAAMVRTVAESTQTDPAMAATAALAVLSACNGGHAEIEVRPGWREPLNTDTAVVAAPGERKSAVQLAMVRPILDTEQQLAESGMSAHLEAKALKQIALKNAEKLRNVVASKVEDEADGKVSQADAIKAAVFPESIEIPAIPRIVADDVTPEKTASLLAEQKGRLATSLPRAASSTSSRDATAAMFRTWTCSSKATQATQSRWTAKDGHRNTFGAPPSPSA